MVAANETKVDSKPQDVNDKHRAELRLLAAGWRDPAELARVCDSLDMRKVDFADRLYGITIEYLRDCLRRGAQPTLTEAEATLRSRCVPHADGELYHVLMDTFVPAGESITDLAFAVQQGADERTNELCRMLAREAFRAWSHAFSCPNCIRCSQVKPSQARLRTVAPRAPKVWRLRYESSNAVG